MLPAGKSASVLPTRRGMSVSREPLVHGESTDFPPGSGGMDALEPPPQQMDLATAFETLVLLQVGGIASS